MKSMYERMLNQELYIGGGDPAVREKFIRGKQLAQAYNHLEFDQFEERTVLLKQLFGKTGERIYMEAPVYVDYGIHTTIGENFYANFGCTLLDVARIRIGDNVMFGPHVSLITAGHPIDALTRIAGPEFGKEITIGDNVWLGANVTVNPGVTIGKNSVIGSGAVVTKDIPENVVAVGNPCRVLRIIGEEEKAYWREQHRQLLGELQQEDSIL